MARPSSLRLLALAIALSVSGAAPGANRTNDLSGAASTACAPGLLGAGGRYWVVAHGAHDGDLPYLEASSPMTGNVVRIYHDPLLKDAAQAAVGCFAGELDLLPSLIPDRSHHIIWMPIVVTTDENYRPPHRTDELRWVIALPSGRWTTLTEKFLIQTMPHEETHGRQSALRKQALPRWFQEGHADWVGLQVTNRVRPDLAQERREALYRASFSKPKPVLGLWGGVRVKQEAINRQLSPGDLARQKTDPNFIPNGPFKFGPGDFEIDRSDGLSHYSAALAVFDGLERRHGRTAVQRWIADVLASASNEQIAPLAQRDLGENIAPLLQ